MSSTIHGYSVKLADATHGYGSRGTVQVSVGKTNPQSNTISLFTVSGPIVASLVGVVSTVFGVTTQHLTLGVTGNATAIAAGPSVALASTAVGSVIQLPSAIGAALPAPVTVTGAHAGAVLLEVCNTIITATSDASTTGAVTWILTWAPVSGQYGASVVTN